MTVSEKALAPTVAPPLFLLAARTEVESRLLQDRVRESGRAGDVPDFLIIGRTPLDANQPLRARLRDLAPGEDRLLVPVRVAWLPKERDGARSARVRDLVLTGDPRNPRASQQRFLVSRDPSRALAIWGEPASVSELRRIYETLHTSAASNLDGFIEFVARRATLALEREEAHLLGPQYKIPRLVREEIRSSPGFRAGLLKLAAETGRDPQEVERAAVAGLDEMVAGYGRTQIDVALRLGRMMYRRGYEDRLDYDREGAEKLLAQARHHAAVLLPSHRSNMDAGVMPSAWHELRLPPTHTFAGINMAFWPLGPIMRRSGSIFIRRDTKEDPVYRYVLREYLGYLVEKRFHLEWYIEGGRSRTGKMLPPRLGLLTYVVDAYLEGRTDDVILVPASITYDQLKEVEDFAAEAHGRAKEKESFGWLFRSLRGDGRGHYGRIYVRFGAPLSLREMLGPTRANGPMDAAEQKTMLNRIGLEVSWRINQATPVTATALVTLSLLGTQGTAVTFEHVAGSARSHLADARRRGLPLTDSAAALDGDQGVDAALDALVGKGVVERCDDGLEPVFVIGPNQFLAAAFYRNSIVHHFLDDSITELAVAMATPGPPDGVLDLAFELRDLFKFDFFFRDKETFRAAVSDSLERREPNWRSLAPEGSSDLLDRFDPLTAHLTLRSFLEAYFVVALALRSCGEAPAPARSDLLTRCAGIARQLLLQRRIHNSESLSSHLFSTGMELAHHRGLMASGTAASRGAFVSQLVPVLDGVHRVEAAAKTQFMRSRMTDG